MSTNKFVKKKDLGEGTRFHELVTKLTVEDDGTTKIGLFQDIILWVKGNRNLRIIQNKFRSKS